MGENNTCTALKGCGVIKLQNTTETVKKIDFELYKMFLNPIFWVTKSFQVNIYTVMLKKHLISILYTNVFAETIYNLCKIPGETEV